MGSGNITLTAQWKWKYIGAKAPSEAKAVGDIVFNDGSAMHYTDFNTLDNTSKHAKKADAIAVIYYKGTELNSGDDTTTLRTLGVSLYNYRSQASWSRGSSSNNCANASWKVITPVVCIPTLSDGKYIFTDDRNGSDNLEQIAEFLKKEGKGDDTADSANYPAFYAAKNYAYNSLANNIAADSEFAKGWYLPSIAELIQIYVCRHDTTNGFNISDVINKLDGDTFEIIHCLSSSDAQDATWGQSVYWFNFSDGTCETTVKSDGSCFTRAIREFN